MKRSSWQITLAAWHALLLREAVARMFTRRMALAWLLAEPVANIGFMAVVFAALRTRAIGGMDAVFWLSTGMLAFFLFKRTATQGAAAIGANLALFTYRQVQPTDTVLARCVLEGLLMVLVAAIVIAALALLGIPMSLHDPIRVLASLLGLWSLGIGWGLAVSVANELTPDLGNAFNVLMTPMMLVSGVIFPVAAVPHAWREWLLMNPVAHGIEGARAGLAGHYHHAPALSLGFLFASALGLVFLGLALQVRFRHRLLSQ